MWRNYSIIARVTDQPPEYQTALFLHAIGIKALEIYNSFDFASDEEKNNLEVIIEKFNALLGIIHLCPQFKSIQ